MAWYDTGEGTPWGAMENGKAAPLIDDPYNAAIHAPDQSALRRAMMQRIAANAGQNQAGALAGLQKAGVQGADSSRAIGRIAGEQGQAQGQLEAQLGQQDFNNRLGLMDAINQNRRAQMQAYNQEQEQRGNFWGGLAKTAGGVAGSWLGGGF